MTGKDVLASKVDQIIANAGDPEVAHSEEDEFRLDVIRSYCPDWVIAEVERLHTAEFPRWHA